MTDMTSSRDAVSQTAHALPKFCQVLLTRVTGGRRLTLSGILAGAATGGIMKMVCKIILQVNVSMGSLGRGASVGALKLFHCQSPLNLTIYC